MGIFLRVGADSLEVVLVREEGVRRANECGTEIGGHGVNDIFLPQKTMATPRAEVGDLQAGHAAQSLDFSPELGFRACIKDVEAELAEIIESRARLEFIHDR